MSVVIETTVGDLTVDLYLKERRNTCLNFLKLCKVKYYNLCIFHKVERNFIAQTGDPTSTGRGGESIFSRLYGDQATYFEAELKPRLKHEKLGTLSMVNNGNNMNGSQFFLTIGENLTYLDEVHTVFGELVEGFETLLKINEAICDPNNRPYQDIRITHTVVLHDPYEDPAALEIPDASPLPTKEQLESNYIGADEEIDDTEGKTVEEVEEKIKESEAKARATILEMVGDLPDADVKPPENVLFVCKLNPVTTSEDLEIIFSRFGIITSCEVIKDKKTGESLQYAFIEFEKEEDCENAFFKMDNVLIDDRRIHVDFSQSVSKLSYDIPQRFARGTNARNQSFVIKDNEKKSDGYDMIFDMDDGLPDSKRERKKANKSADRRHKRYDSPTRSYGERNQKRSDSFNQRDHKRFRDSSSYQSRKYEEHPKSGSSKDKRHGSDYNSSHFSKARSPSISYNKTSRRNQTHHISSSNEAYSSDNAPSKTVKTYSKKKGHRDSSSSSHSVSLSPPRQNRSKHKSSYRTENSSLSQEFNQHKKTPISATYKDKERKHGFSRHRSRSLDSNSPKQVPSHTRLCSQSPESSKSKAHKSKHASSRRRSKSVTPPRRKKAEHRSLKMRSSSPELNYRERTNPKELSSLKHQSRSSNSSSPEQRKGYAIEKSDTRSRSSKKHPSKYDSYTTRSPSKSPKAVDHKRVFRHASPVLTKDQDRRGTRNLSISSDSEFEVKASKTKNKKHIFSSSKTEKHHKKHKHSKSYS